MPDELIIAWHSQPQPSRTATLGEAHRAAASFNLMPHPYLQTVNTCSTHSRTTENLSLNQNVRRLRDSMPQSTHKTQPSLRSPISSIRRYADSFRGLTVAEVRKRLHGGKISRAKWDGGNQLVGTFPTHEVRVFFLGRTALLTSIQILSDGSRSAS